MLTEWEKEYWESRIELSKFLKDFTYSSEIKIISLLDDKVIYEGCAGDFLEYQHNDVKYLVDLADVSQYHLEIVVVEL